MSQLQFTALFSIYDGLNIFFNTINMLLLDTETLKTPYTHTHCSKSGNVIFLPFSCPYIRLLSYVLAANFTLYNDLMSVILVYW